MTTHRSPDKSRRLEFPLVQPIKLVIKTFCLTLLDSSKRYGFLRYSLA